MPGHVATKCRQGTDGHRVQAPPLHKTPATVTRDTGSLRPVLSPYFPQVFPALLLLACPPTIEVVFSLAPAPFMRDGHIFLLPGSEAVPSKKSWGNLENAEGKESWQVWRRWPS